MPWDYIELEQAARNREGRDYLSRRIVEFCAFRGTSDHALYSARQLVGRTKIKSRNVAKASYNPESNKHC